MFYEWFGDSKVVDEQGRPLVVYHGTNAKFSEFQMKEIGLDFPEAAYFSSKEQVAETYTYRGIILPVYLRFENPYIVNANERTFNSYYDDFSSAMYNTLDDGHDGLIVKNIRDDKFQGGGEVADTYVAFSPNQIKSTSNRGTFSKASDDIRYQTGGEHRGRGYVGYSMSVNMAEAQANGELPASKAASALGVSTQAIKEVLSPSAWHHASSYYNRVNVYDINPYLALKEGKPIPEDYEDDADEIMANWEAMKNMPKPDKSVEQFYGDAKWLEWGGTRSHPKATEHKYENIKIEKKGSFYTFYLPDGTTVRKKTDSNGTYVVSEEEKAERLERQKQQEEMQHWNNVRHEKLAEISKQYQKEYDAYKKENNLDNPGFAEFEKFQTETNRDGDNIYLQHQKPYSEHKDVGLRRVHLDWISSERKEVAQLQEWDGEKWNVIDTKEDFQNNRWGEPIKERYHFARERTLSKYCKCNRC